jgi:hypothetical protein
MVQHTFEDVEQLANQLDFIVVGNDFTFDMDKRGESLLGGTWVNTPQGLENAYQYLVNYQRSHTHTSTNPQ